MKIRVFDFETGEEIEGDFIIEGNELWQYEFGSCDSATEPTRAWAGEQWKIMQKVRVEIIIEKFFNL